MDIDLIFSELFTGEGSGLILIAFAIAFFIAIFVSVSAGWFRIILSIASFAYPSARVRAMGNPLVTADGADTLSDASDLLDLFERAGRFGHIIEYREGMGPDDTERLIRQYHYTLLGNLAVSVPDAIHSLIFGYIQVYLAEEVAAVLRGINGGLPGDLIEKRAVPIGAFSESEIRKAAHSGSVEEAVQRLDRSGVITRIRDIWKAVGEQEGYAAFEAALLSDAYGSLMMTARGIEESQYEPAVLMAGRMIDCQNLRILIRGRLYGADAAAIEPFLIQRGGFEITDELLLNLARSADLVELVSLIRETMYGPYIEPFIEQVRKSRDPGAIELGLSQCLLDIGRMVSSQYHLGSGPILRYLVALGIECENLRGAAAGILYHVPAGTIRGQMVVEVGGR
ncbi:MAG: H+transporting two-sector ATPase C (AC39) subunit [Methanomicrobiales archaeon 53_19]|uniref:V-type ATPase subunit n=1 Tax=Methanocalculus sp. TaxID=2004547 RepID=UPI00074679BB|nr:V-type ATPase subunit [Methanocalculus sp.]KUK69674.1 MAG: H+transporting two-sector ATPase C (AC39) subunit [Methanocalculus sp. 52_23]KUL02545.1 MAG: H+transporting two-sector ATPase C (AC39) subunit [Methanomicrobiales archaeon 53_19]HIJ06371.1 V-type ATPase subunit [Methanocalculus sp.]